MPTDQPRTYKHQLTEAEFVSAFTATAEEFEARKEEMRGKGVERLTKRELFEGYRIEPNSVPISQLFTFIGETQVYSEWRPFIAIQDLEKPFPGLVHCAPETGPLC
jgi:hypothetical protein